MTENLLHLAVQTFNTNESTKNRIIECIHSNLAKNWIGKITILDEGFGVGLPVDSKISVIPISKRATYSDFMKVMFNENSSIYSHFGIANSDIFFSDDVESLLFKIKKTSTAICLTRHELAGGLCHNPKDSQDAWIFRQHSPASRLLDSSQYELGIAGCEVCFATALYSYGYDLWNPYIDCEITHNDPNPRIHFSDRYQGAYTLIHPCKLEDIEKTPSVYEQVIYRGEFSQG